MENFGDIKATRKTYLKLKKTKKKLALMKTKYRNWKPRRDRRNNAGELSSLRS